MSMEVDETEWKAIEAGLRAEGFLSPFMAKLIANCREANAGPFAHATGLNRLGMAMAMENDDIVVGKTTHDPVCLGYRIFLRCLSTFQGALVLAERGMDAETDTLVRGIYEGGFWIGFLWKDGSQASQEIVADEKANKRALYKIMKEMPQASPADIDLLDEAIAAYEKTSAAQLKKVAERSGVFNHYRFYRELSASSAHVSLHSLHRYVNRQPDGSYNGHVFGPNPEAIYRSLWYACDALRVSIASFIYLIGGTTRDDEFRELLGRHDADFPTPERGR